MKGVKRSLLIKYFSRDVLIQILKIIKIPNASNHDKNILIKQCLRDNNIPFDALGPGTNRMAVLIDGYAVKIALDNDGMIDNKREFKYTKRLQPYVVKCYECTTDGLVMCCEFVELFNYDDFGRNQSKMREILKDISKTYLIGDVGITSKNYVNWGTRIDNSICILDFAYIYETSYTTFKCIKCKNLSLLQYDNNYEKLTCPTCGRIYEFGEIRRRISREAQDKEIGDIRSYSYNLTKSLEEVELVEEYEPIQEQEEKELPEWKKNILIAKEIESHSSSTDNYWAQ